MLLSALLVLSQAQSAQPEARAWEKLIAPGVTYRMEVVPGTPWLVNAVRVSRAAQGLVLVPELANGTVFDPSSPSKGRETVTGTAVRTGSLVAVNADFFPYTGDPLGVMVRDGELVSSPHSGRSAFVWGKGAAECAYIRFSASFLFEGKPIEIDGVNEECGENMVVLSTHGAGYALSRQPATHAVVQFPGKLGPVGEWKGTVVRLVEGATDVPVGEGEAVITFTGTPKEKLVYLGPGDEVTVRVECTGPDWAKFDQAIAGGPFLVKSGKTFVPFEAEGFTDGFAKNRHPRTAIGVTDDGDVWIVTVDGRQSMSDGATLAEMAGVMVRLGCVQAINLDGGGSTTLNISGLTVNRPSEGSERAVANALLVLKDRIPPPSIGAEPGLVVAGPASIQFGSSAAYRLVDSTGADVPQSEVVWSAQGSAWIDQAGRLTAASEGACHIRAVARGQTASLTVQVAK